MGIFGLQGIQGPPGIVSAIYTYSRGRGEGMTQIKTSECAQKKCSHLLEMKETGRAYRICDITRRIPGNMMCCPLERRKGEILENEVKA